MIENVDIMFVDLAEACHRFALLKNVYYSVVISAILIK